MIEKQPIQSQSEKVKDRPKNLKPFATAAQVLFLATSVLTSGCLKSTATPSTTPPRTLKAKPKEKRLSEKEKKELLCKDLKLERVRILEELYVTDLREVDRIKEISKQLHANLMQINEIWDICKIGERP